MPAPEAPGHADAPARAGAPLSTPTIGDEPPRPDINPPSFGRHAAWLPPVRGGSLMDFAADRPARPVDWRWRRAGLLLDSGLRWSRRRDDGLTREAKRFRAALRRCRDEAARSLLAARTAGLGGAWLLAGGEPRVRWAVEARLLAGELAAAVAGKLALAPEAVAWYEALFFNVSGRLANRGYLLHCAVGERTPGGPAGGSLGVTWKSAALAGGPGFLDEVIRATWDAAAVPSDLTTPVAAWRPVPGPIGAALAAMALPNQPVGGIGSKAILRLAASERRYAEVAADRAARGRVAAGRAAQDDGAEWPEVSDLSAAGVGPAAGPGHRVAEAAPEHAGRRDRAAGSPRVAGGGPRGGDCLGADVDLRSLSSAEAVAGASPRRDVVTGLDARGNYSRSVRIGGKVTRVFFGKGPAAQLAAVLDDQRRAERRSRAEAWQAGEAAWADAEAGQRELDGEAELMMRATLLAAGYYRRGRGRWHRRRASGAGASGGEDAGTLGIACEGAIPSKGGMGPRRAVPPPGGPADRPPAADEFRAIVDAAERGDRAGLPAMRGAVAPASASWAHAGRIALSAEAAWVALIAGDNSLQRTALARKFAGMTEELAGPDAPPLERLLAVRVACCWLRATQAADALVRLARRGATVEQAKLLRRRQRQAWRSHAAAIEVLAAARRLGVAAPPAVPPPAVEASPRRGRSGRTRSAAAAAPDWRDGPKAARGKAAGRGEVVPKAIRDRLKGMVESDN